MGYPVLMVGSPVLQVDDSPGLTEAVLPHREADLLFQQEIDFRTLMEWRRVPIDFHGRLEKVNGLLGQIKQTTAAPDFRGPSKILEMV